MAAEGAVSVTRSMATQPRVKSRGRPPRIKPGVTRIMAQRVLSERLSAASAAAWFGVCGERLSQQSRGEARLANARQAAIYFAHIVFRANLTRAGGIFGRDRTTARHACMRMEDRRDDRRFDRACGALEPAMRLWLARFNEQARTGEAS